MPTDVVVGTFYVLPLLLTGLLAWATFAAWQRSGASRAAASRAAVLAAAGSLIWMTITWAIARSGVLGNFDQTPPPFAFLVLAIFIIAGGIAWSTLGRRLAEFIPL